MNRKQLNRAAEVLRAGGIVAYPTESCYGLGCDPRRSAALRRLLRLKRRPRELGLILIADDVQRLTPWFNWPDDTVRTRVLESWPGPITWLLPARHTVNHWLRGDHDTLALRVTAHPGAAALCRHAGLPLVSTSANRHGHPPARSAGAVRRQFGNAVDYILEGNLGDSPRPTEIRDALSGKVLRKG
jgi:L-threonylcarbamoyladenylate synthase